MMDITKFYELRKRLYALTASGAALISEDFRLKRAVEEFGAEMASSKPMMKLYTLCTELFTTEKPADKLAECLSSLLESTWTESTEWESCKRLSA